MSARQLVGVVLLGAVGWAALRRWGTTLPADPLRPPSALPGAVPAPSGYQASTAARESGGNLYAKSGTSSASGKYGFTRATWLSMGGAWGPDGSKPFGGLRPSEAEQDARFRQLTGGNAAGLARAGIAATESALYAAHFLGLPMALKVLTAPASTNLAALVGSKVMAANPQLHGFNVGDFRRWLETH